MKLCETQDRREPRDNNPIRLIYFCCTVGFHALAMRFMKTTMLNHHIVYMNDHRKGKGKGVLVLNEVPRHEDVLGEWKCELLSKLLSVEKKNVTRQSLERE